MATFNDYSAPGGSNELKKRALENLSHRFQTAHDMVLGKMTNSSEAPYNAPTGPLDRRRKIRQKRLNTISNVNLLNNHNPSTTQSATTSANTNTQSDPANDNTENQNQKDSKPDGDSDDSKQNSKSQSNQSSQSVPMLSEAGQSTVEAAGGQ